MKLYELHKGQRFYLLLEDGSYVKDSDNAPAILIFNKIDGIYSICFYKTDVLHIAAASDVEIIK